ncbi:hypothetical protein ACFOSD_00115 [Salinispirillum marinum]|uniref:Glycerophosphoryl diester phosphodiesterase membrane domain-containing protein n=2 Tax=Saccharospirillaceae TaxID=255527 RepID=A0ABV8B8W3_9GAMM
MQLPVELKLPIGDVVSAAFRLPVQMASTLWTALRWPILLLVVVRLGTMNMGGEQPDIILLMSLSVVLIAITAMIAVPAHQLFITGKTEHPPGLRFGGAEFLYAGWTLGLPILIMVIASLVAMPLVVVSTMTGLGVFGSIGLFIALIVAILVYGRFSMIFPRIALGLDGGLRAAGKMAAGHYWRVGVLGIVFPLLISVLPLFLQSSIGGLIGNVLAIMVSVYFNLVQVAILALIFRWLREFEPESQEEPPEDDDDDPFDGEQPWLDDTSRKD